MYGKQKEPVKNTNIVAKNQPGFVSPKSKISLQKLFNPRPKTATHKVIFDRETIDVQQKHVQVSQGVARPQSAFLQTGKIRGTKSSFLADKNSTTRLSQLLKRGHSHIMLQIPLTSPKAKLSKQRVSVTDLRNAL